MSIFLHAFASSSGVSVGGVSESDEAGVLFERYSRYVVNNLSAFAAIERGSGRVLEGGEGRGLIPYRKVQATRKHLKAEAFLLHARMKLNYRSGVRSRTSSDYGTKMIDNRILTNHSHFGWQAV